MNSLTKYSFTIFLVTAFFITKFSFGQKPVIGIKAGIALSNATITPAGMGTFAPKASTRVGVLGGVYLDVPSGKQFIFRPGIELVSKGTRQNDNFSYDYPVIFTFLDFPLSVLYKKNYTKGHFIAGGGPVIGVPIKDYYTQYPLKTEIGINGLAGYEFPIGFSFNLNYSYGISNASNNKQIYSKISNRYLGITLGYNF